MNTQTIANIINEVAPAGTYIGPIEAANDDQTDLTFQINLHTLNLEEWAPGETVTLHLMIDDRFWYVDELESWDEDAFRKMMVEYFVDGFERAHPVN